MQFRGIGANAGTKVSLYAYVTGAGRYMTFESPDGTDYQVPANKTFKITRMIYFSTGNDITMSSIGYGDDGVAEGAAAPTTPKYVLGNGDAGFYGSLFGGTANLHVPPPVVDVYAEVPTGKYPFLKCVATTGVATDIRAQIFGLEE